MRVALVGAGVLGTTVLHHSYEQKDIDVVGFFDDYSREPIESLEILGGLEEIPQKYKNGLFDEVLITIGYNHINFREKLFSELTSMNIPFATSIHPSASISRNVKVEQGCIIFPGCIIDDNAKVGQNSILNAGCVISHDSNIGPHSFLGPGVNISGFVNIGKCSFIGVGTTIIDNLDIGPHTQTGGGAVVTQSSGGGKLLVGIPAKVVRNSDNKP